MKLDENIGAMLERLKVMDVELRCELQALAAKLEQHAASLKQSLEGMEKQMRGRTVVWLKDLDAKLRGTIKGLARDHDAMRGRVDAHDAKLDDLLPVGAGAGDRAQHGTGYIVGGLIS